MFIEPGSAARSWPGPADPPPLAPSDTQQHPGTDQSGRETLYHSAPVRRTNPERACAGPPPGLSRRPCPPHPPGCRWLAPPDWRTAEHLPKEWRDPRAARPEAQSSLQLTEQAVAPA